MVRAILIQIFWLILLNVLGRLLAARGEKRAVVQGG